MPADYNNTLNLPVTDFAMRANLPGKEPKILEKWYGEDIYARIIEKNSGRPLFLLHDGPPYANGDIHTGHALNKTLKDFVVKYKNMAGYNSPHIPGWDTHGLPIESQAIKKFGLSVNEVSPAKFRHVCRDFALGYVDGQREQMKRLGAFADWDDPYMTLQPEFESRQIEIFGEMAKRGYIYKGLKPVYWCPHDETALAEAEIEYGDDPCDSIYVKFPVVDDKGLIFDKAPGIEKISFIIWTTTTWTIPANLAISLGPDFEYSLVKVGANEAVIMASELIEDVMEIGGITGYETLATWKGSELEYVRARHPYLDRDSLIIVGDHVTLDSGTGCVHTAPGHGADDFDVCKRYPEIPMFVAIDEKGKMVEGCGDEFVGMYVEQANEAILNHLADLDMLFATQRITHQYPHCWRCKTPILFRVTEQWFCSVEDFKDEAISAIKSVKWYPAWGEERMSAMVRERADWCISRQRLWGVPIPIFYCTDCDEVIIDDDTIKSVAEIFRTEGSDAWFLREAAELLPDGYKCPKCGGSHFEKESDIMDVWFDSGTSHSAVLESGRWPGQRWPADLYLEGNDQYRGWFQSSLLTSVATKGKAPYKSVVMHGFIVDGEGRKMSKSLGNGIEPLEIISEYGADILRLWVASADYQSEMKISKDILKQVSEIYRKIRNTARFILGNIGDFDPENDSVPVSDMVEIDRWALAGLSELIDKVRAAYDEYEFYNAFHAIHNYCVVDMSNFYLDVLKDRLYCEDTGGLLRRSAQSAMFMILEAIDLMLAPIIPFTTEEIWQAMPHSDDRNTESVFLNDIPKEGETVEVDIAKWDKILEIRDDAKKQLEEARTEKRIGSSLEASITLFADDEYDFLSENADLLETVFIVSSVRVERGDDGVKGENFPSVGVQIGDASGEKCERCWKYSDTVGENAEHPTLCARCAAVLERR